LSQVHPVLFHIGPVFIPAYGAVAAIGVLLALLLAQRTARIAGVDASQLWNLCVVALFAALIGSRLLLIAANWSELFRHPSWIFGLGMVHHPLVAAAGAIAGLTAAAVYARMHRMALGDTGDALAAPVALGLAFEQFGALLAGAGFGTATAAKWGITYTSVLAARWSGTPLGISLHPVQAYASIAFLTLSISLLVWLPARRQAGDVAGLWLMFTGVAMFLTELWRDPEGRGSFLRGALDGPQIAAIGMVILSAVVLREQKASRAADPKTVMVDDQPQDTNREAHHA
jgi:phosphatidylglycerol:prolipoprotein diacylglycerol transferase